MRAGIHHEDAKGTKIKDGDLGIGLRIRHSATPGIGEDAILLRAGVSRKDAKTQGLLARVGLPDHCFALLSTFNFLPTNLG